MLKLSDTSKENQIKAQATLDNPLSCRFCRSLNSKSGCPEETYAKCREDGIRVRNLLRRR